MLSARDVEEMIQDYTWETEEDEWVYVKSAIGGRWEKTGGRITVENELDWYGIWSDEHDWPISIPGLGDISLVANHGGEGQGDEAWVVISVTDSFGDVKLYRKDGYYRSYEGAGFDTPLRQVQPKEKTVTVYE